MSATGRAEERPEEREGMRGIAGEGDSVKAILCMRGKAQGKGPTESDLQAVEDFGKFLREEARRGMRCRKCKTEKVEYYAVKGPWRVGTYCAACVEGVDCEIVELI